MKASDGFCSRVCAWQVAAAVVIVTFIWLNESLDFPFLIMGAPPTSVNWRESLLETIVVVPIFGLLIVWTRRVLARLRLLEGVVPVCSNCRKIRDEKGAWAAMEVYFHERARTDFSHGICPDCLARLYPEVAKKREADSSGPQP